MLVDGKFRNLRVHHLVNQRSFRNLGSILAALRKGAALLMWLLVVLSTPSAWAENEESEVTAEPNAVQTLTIEDAYRQAMANEEQVKIAERELAKAQLLPWRAIALLTPRADVAGVFTRNKEEIAFSGFPTGGMPGGEDGGGTTTFPSVIRPLESWVGTFSVTQPLIQPSFIPFWRLGKDSIRQNAQRYGFTLREVLFGVARAYYEVLRAQAQVGVAKETLSLTHDELKQAQARFRVGEVTKTDMLRAEVEVARSERALITAGNNVQLTTTVLARAVGVRGAVRVVEPTPPSFPGEPYEQLLDKAHKQRQDLRAQDAAVDVARQRRNLQRARYFPSVGAQWQFPKLDSPTFATRDEFWTLTLNFQVPIFDGGVRELDLQEEEENLFQARLQLDRLKKDVGVEVKQTLVAAETLAATLDTLKKEVALAQENYTITSRQYRVGLATSLDVNTALNALNQVRTQLTDQTYAYQLALLGVERATGAFAQEYVSQR